MNCKRVLILFGIIFFPSLIQAQVNPSKINAGLLQKSVKAVLGTEHAVTWHRVAVRDSVQKTLTGQLKAKQHVADTLYIGKVTTGKGPRFLIPDIAPSRSEQFSYVLYVNQSKSITGVDVLEYRENYGYEIDYPFFRKQFEGKQQANKIIFDRTIQNISGATISARSITYSIHDLLLILNHIQLP